MIGKTHVRLFVITVTLATIVITGFVASTASGQTTTNKDQASVPGLRVLSKQELQVQLDSASVERARLEVRFKTPLPENQVREMLSAHVSSLKSMFYRWREHSGGYRVKSGQTVTEALNDFEKKHAEFLSRHINNLSAPDKSMPAVNKSSDPTFELTKKQLLQEFLEQMQLLTTNGFMVAGFEAEGERNGLQKMVDVLPGDIVGRIETPGAPDNVSKEMGPRTTSTLGSSEHSLAKPYPEEDEQWKFTPSQGKVIYDSKAKFFTSYFSWSDVSGFTDLHFGYEHEIIIIRDLVTYVMSRDEWHSNLPDQPRIPDNHSTEPRKYKDNTLSDKHSAFTVGTAAATAIRTGTLYYTDVSVHVHNPDLGPVLGEVEAQLSSWAGEYNQEDPVPEAGEKLFCETFRHLENDFAACMFPSQIQPLRNYYNENGVFYHRFLFDHRVDSTYYWDRASSRTPPILNCPQDTFKAEYTNKSEERLVYARCEPAPLNHEWDRNGPGLNDHFEAKWTGRFNFPQTGKYRFIAASDDGIRVYVDNALIIDGWRDRSETEDRAEHTVAAGVHEVRVEYYENTGDAAAKLRWEFVGTNPNCSAVVATNRWKGEYFNNVALSGTPIMIRDDSATTGTSFFAHSWGTGSPSSTCGVNPDDFSARWTRRQFFDAGRYRFTIRTDDGMRLFVDNALKLDRWSDQPPTNHSVEVDLTAGEHDLKVEYYERGGGAVAQIFWERINTSVGSSCNATVAANRWKGEYFNNIALSGSPIMVRDDSSTNGMPFFAHSWGTGSPSSSCGVNSDHFSARWTRRQSLEAGRYRFTIRTDDGMRLFVDNALKLDRWSDQSPTNHSVEVDLTSGEHDLKVEYYERAGGAVAQIFWERISSSGGHPTVAFSMSGGGQSGTNGQTLAYSVAAGGNVTITFDAANSIAGSGSVSSYDWRSNNTSISSQRSFNFTFGRGTHNISLTVRNSAGLASTATGVIVVNEQVASAPTARFTMGGGGQSGSNGQTLTYSVPAGGNVTITFDAANSVAGSGSISSYDWRSNNTSISSQRSFNFTFGRGTHNISLTVRNSAGLASTATGVIVVNEQVASAPTARFTMSGGGNSGTNGQTLTYSVSTGGNVTITFDAANSVAGSGSISSYDWRSNNTSISSQRSFNFTFGRGTHNISLTVRNSAGLTSTATGVIVVNEASCPGKFCIGDTVTVFNTGGAGLRLRQCASTNSTTCPVIVTMADGTRMQVFGGPVTADGFIWWAISGNVNGTFRTGWAVQDFLTR